MGSFETTTALYDVLQEMRQASSPSSLTYEPERSLTVTTREVTADEVILTRVRSI